MAITLEAGWTAEELAKANAFMAIDANKTPQAYQTLFDSVVPNLFSAYKIKDNDFLAAPQSGAESTVYAGLPHVGVYYIKEHLNSLKEGGNRTDYAPYYFPIVVEVETRPDDPSQKWTQVTELTGREILADGTIFLPVLRLLPFSTPDIRNFKWTGGEFNGTMVARKIRFTCVLYGDPRVNMTAFQPGFRNDLGGNFVGPVNFNIDADRFAPGYKRAELINTNLYAYQHRADNSWPIPESSAAHVGEGAYEPTELTRYGVQRDDHQKALIHVYKVMWERSVLQKSGQLEYEGRIVNMPLGTTVSRFVKSDGSNAVRANTVVSGIHYKSVGGETKTTVYLGNVPR
jgi:hypothetical protein